MSGSGVTWSAGWRCAGLVVGVLLTACATDGGDGADGTTTSAEATSTTTAEASPLPDLGGRLMFSRFNERTHEFQSAHIAEPDGSGEVELELPGPEGGGRWSTDGKHIAVLLPRDDGRLGTAIITPDGVVERVLPIPDPSLHLVCRIWSLDDARLACDGWDDTDASRTGLYVVNATDGSVLTRLTSTPEGLEDFGGDFSPDGRSFVFYRAEGEADGPMFVVAVAGGGLRRLGDRVYEDAGRFSPDGSTIATAGQGSIVLLDLDGEVVQEITRRGTYLFGPSWSPDGKWLAYSGSSVGPHADIFVSRLDGSDVHRITDTPDNEIVVEWSRA